MQRVDRGIGLVEASVALVVVVVVAVAALPSLVGSRADRLEHAARHAASAYERAIEAYRADHDGAVPVIGQSSWPSGAIARGPLDADAASDADPGGVPYLTEGAPDEVVAGEVSVNAADAGKAGSYARVEFHPGETLTAPYELRVRVREHGSWSTLCSLGTARVSTPRC